MPGPQNVPGLASADVLRILSRSSEFLPHFALVAGGPPSLAPLVALELAPDPSSWFPRIIGHEPGGGRYVARVTAHIGLDPTLAPAQGRRNVRLVRAFRGWSTVLLTDERLTGICPRGEALSGPVDFEGGTVVAWSFPLRHVQAAGVVDVAGEAVVAVRSTDRLVGGVTLGSVHQVVDGSLRPLAPEEVAATLNTTTRRRPAPRPEGAEPRAEPRAEPWS